MDAAKLSMLSSPTTVLRYCINIRPAMLRKKIALNVSLKTSISCGGKVRQLGTEPDSEAKDECKISVSSNLFFPPKVKPLASAFALVKEKWLLVRGKIVVDHLPRAWH